jgi:hypothetical protein
MTFGERSADGGFGYADYGPDDFSPGDEARHVNLMQRLDKLVELGFAGAERDRCLLEEIRAIKAQLLCHLYLMTPALIIIIIELWK